MSTEYENQTCHGCNGEQVIDGSNGPEICPTCDGKGTLSVKVSSRPLGDSMRGWDVSGKKKKM